MKKKFRNKVLFVCTNNSARSQMAEGLLRKLCGSSCKVSSAGTQPTSVSPNAVFVMKEIGIDISAQRSKSIVEFDGQVFDCVVTLCDSAKESCPVFPGAKKTLHKSFSDPARTEGSEEEILKRFRQVRDEISEWILETFCVPISCSGSGL